MRSESSTLRSVVRPKAAALFAVVCALGASSALAAPSIQFTKTPDGSTITAGTLATFTYVVKNNAAPGEGNNSDFPQLVDPLPGGGGIVWDTTTPGCSVSGPQGGQVLECDFNALPGGTQTGATAFGTPNTCTVLTSTATLEVANNAPSTLTDAGTINVTSDLCRPLFVIGDKEAHGIGATVNFWGSQWWKNNDMTGLVDKGVASFKGYASDSDNFCGGMWETRPGNSSNPPATIPTDIMVIVTDTVQKDGPDITGSIKQILMVHSDGGYGPAPGHRGNGTVTQVLCPAP
jgi:hypothetical protein